MSTVHCDRCQSDVEGYIDPEGWSAGVYVTTSYWSKFANPGEKQVCDACMWADPRYIAKYGTRTI